MATIGVDAMVILDSTGYFVKPNTYTVKEPRIRHSSYRADGTLSYVDLGPGKRLFSMVILCQNELREYDGDKIATSGQAFRDALRTSYAKTAQTISFSDPKNTSVSVYFDHLEEKIIDLHSQIIALATGGSLAASYEVLIELREA